MAWVNVVQQGLASKINKVRASSWRLILGTLLLAVAHNAMAFSGTLNFSGSDAVLGTTVNDGEANSTDIGGVVIEIYTANLGGNTNQNVSWEYLSDFAADGPGDVDDGIADASGDGGPSIIIRTQGGEDFSFSGIEILNYLGIHGSLKFEGFRGGVSTGSETLVLDGGDFHDTFTQANGLTAAKFENVDEIRITEPSNADFYIAIDTIVFAEPVLPAPTITSATYNASTGALVVTGTNFTATGGATNDVVANRFTFTGEGSSTYTLTDTANVEIASATSLTLSLSATDRAAVNLVVNKNGTSSTGGTTYNIAGATGFIAAAAATADLTGNGVTVSNTASPTVTSATYNANTGVLVVTGANLRSAAGATNDIVANRFTLTGEGGSTYTLTDTANVEVTSGTSFTMTLSATDRAAANLIMNQNGPLSTDISSYILEAADNWNAGADAALNIADTSGNGITVSNVAIPTITSATYNASTGVLVVTSTGLLKSNGAANDIVANLFTLTGQGGSTYTLTDTGNVEVTSGTSFTLTLSATDRNAVNLLLNQNGTSSTGGTTYNLAAAEDWAAGADSAVVVADLTGNGITASNAVSAPGAPTIGTATAGDGQVSVTFTAPGSNGGSAITTYTATASPGGAFGTCAGPAACTATVAGLSNGTAYTFTVTATNAIGTSIASGASNSATPKTDQSITFTNPGAQNFGTTPTLTATSDSGLTVTFSSTTTGVCTVAGNVLTLVTAGACTIDADQAGNAGTNAATTVTRSFTINAIVPNAPTIGTATAGDTQASVTFTAPASSGGAAITGYTVTSNPGGITAGGNGFTTSPITVTGLTNGVSYTFTVTATNSAGTGSASGASNSITPAAPQTITFNNPGAQNFGTTPTLSATSSAGGGYAVSFTTATAGVCTITTGGVLTFVTAGSCTINANQAGDSSYLAAPQVSQTFTVAPIAPGAPTAATAIAGDTQASIAFTSPVFVGGATITGYTVTVSPADVAPVNGVSSPIVVTGLTNGQAYTFTVMATNSAGTGSASVASNSVTPAAIQTITFANPGAQNFGTTPTLIATTDATGLTPTFTSSTTGVCTITSGGALTFVSAGTCTINADQAGDGTYLAAPQVTRSFTVNAVVPSAPTAATASAGNTQAAVSFSAPAFTGGVAITSYTVTANPGGATAAGASSPITVTGLTNGTPYTFTVTATNSVGTGVASTASAPVTPMGTQTITFSNPGAQTMGTSPTLSATASSGLSLSFSSSTPGVCTVTSGGALTLIAAGNCSISADQSGNGAYLVAATVSQSFAVNPAPNVAPVITQGASVNVTMSEDGAPTAFALTLTATDSDNDPLTWSISGAAQNGSASVSGGSVSYTPTANYHGSDSFVVQVSDGEDTDSITVNVTITPINDLPVISGTPAISVEQDAAYSFTPTATDVDTADVLTFSIINKPSWAGFNTATGALTGTPTNADAGSWGAIVISVSDGPATASLAAFEIEVIATIDPLQPIVTAPADLELNATALFTPVTLSQLLGMNPSVTQGEIDQLLKGLASDGVSGNACCTTNPEGLNASNTLLLPPGRHQVKWKATNAVGVSGEAIQVINIKPLVSLSKSQLAVRGSEVEFRVLLNGSSPVYPFSVPYVINTAETTAAATEHSLVNGIATFTRAGQLEVAIPVILPAVTGFSDSVLVVALGNGINAGAAKQHVIQLRQGNIPPVVSLSISQGGVNTSLVTPSGGPVTVRTLVNDANLLDTHTFDWSATSGLADTDGNPTDANRSFDPASLTGGHQLLVTVTDSAGASVQAQAYFRVIASLPVLDADTDTDKDGISDTLEGAGDSDNNGIPDYLDNMPSPNILPQQGNTTNSYLIECDPGVRCGLGLFARGSTSGGVQVLDDEIGSLDDLIIDPAFEPVGGIFDFTISDLPTPGQSVRVVIPQQAAIPANAVYRKFHNGQWVSFVSDADNALHSAAGNPGYCPPPGAADWTVGLTEGHLCVQLTLEDGGPNDDDGLVNAAIVDPGAVSEAKVVVPPVEPPVEPPKPPVQVNAKGGGAVSALWLLLLGGLIILNRFTPTRWAVLALAVFSINTQAMENAYLRLDVFTVNSSHSEADFTGALEDADHQFSLNSYDDSRTGFQIAAGYQWSELTYSEVGYLDLGDVEVNLTLDGDTDLDAFASDFADNYPITATGATLVQGLSFKAGSAITFSIEAGAFVWKGEVELDNAAFVSKDDEGVDPLAGLKIDLALGDAFSLGLSGRRLFFGDQDIDLYAVSSTFRF